MTPLPWPLRLLRPLLPIAERDEVLSDLAAEYGERQAGGSGGARRWLWRQVAASVPALLRRSAWRGMTGFEPRANRMRPGGPLMEGWIIDVRYALRRLRARPLYACLAVLTLALGVGGAAAITGVVRSLLVKPLPVVAEQEVEVFWNPFDWNEQEMLYMRPEWPGFQAVAGYRQEGVTLQVGDAPARLFPGISGSAELFEVLGRDAFLGRSFRKGDDLQGAVPIAVLSHPLWKELGADPSIVGKPLRLDGVERTVAGVMPEGFWFPDPETRVWLPETLEEDNRRGNYAMVGRRAPGVTHEGIGPHLARITARLDERYDYPAQWDKTKNAQVTPVREFLVGDVRPALLATFAAMALLLLMACANVAALMLGQVEGRSTELAVRSALGAERGRLVQQLVAESVVVGLGAALVGALVAAAGFRFLVDALPLGVWAHGATLDWSVFAAAIVAALVASVGVALVPVVSLWRGDLRGVLANSRTGGIGGRGGRLESGLVVAEVALAVLMAAGAALLARSVTNLYAIDPGLKVEGLAVLDVSLPEDMKPEQQRAALARLASELSALPGVESAAVGHKLPLRGRGSSSGIRVEGDPGEEVTTTFFRIVSPGYLETLGYPLKSGRLLQATDIGKGEPAEGEESAVVINEALAAKYFPGQDPLGRVLTGGFGVRERIVGVVGNVAEARLTDAPAPARYWLVEHAFVMSRQSIAMRVRPGLDPVSVLDPARQVVHRVAPTVAVEEATTMEAILAEAVGPARQVLFLLGLLTVLAVVLGAIGVYGVIAHFVSRRQRDWAIRIALGLAPRHVVGSVVRRGAGLLAIGIAVGVAAAVVLARLIGSLLYGVSAADPAAMAAAGAALLVVGLLAALIPAWRAGRTEPASLLREA
jgi:putative ABC transport system permease protein